MPRRRIFFASSGEVDQFIDPDTIPGRVLHLEPSGIATLSGRGTVNFTNWTCSTAFGTVLDNVGLSAPTVDGITLNSYQGCRFDAFTTQHVKCDVVDGGTNSHLWISNTGTSETGTLDNQPGLFTMLMVARRYVLDASEADAPGTRRYVWHYPTLDEYTVDKYNLVAPYNVGLGLHSRFDATDTKYYFQAGFQYGGVATNKDETPDSAGGAGDFDSVGYLTTGGNVIVCKRAMYSNDGGSSYKPFITVGTMTVTDQSSVNRGVAWAVDEELQDLLSNQDYVESGTAGLFIGGNGGSTNALGSGLDIFEVVQWGSDGSSESGRVVEYASGNIRVRTAGVSSPLYDAFGDPSRSITSVGNWLRDKYGIDTA